MKPSLIKGNSDFLLGVIIIAFSVTVYALSCRIAMAESAMLPKFLAAFMAAMGLGISIKSIVERSRSGSDSIHVSGKEIFTGIIFPGLFLLGAFFLINYLGFFVAEFILIVALMFLQDKVTNGKINFGKKRLITVLLFALGVMLVMYVIFHYLFALPTPKGIFGF